MFLLLYALHHHFSFDSYQHTPGLLQQTPNRCSSTTSHNILQWFYGLRHKILAPGFIMSQTSFPYPDKPHSLTLFASEQLSVVSSNWSVFSFSFWPFRSMSWEALPDSLQQLGVSATVLKHHPHMYVSAHCSCSYMSAFLVRLPTSRGQSQDLCVHLCIPSLAYLVQIYRRLSVNVGLNKFKNGLMIK